MVTVPVARNTVGIASVTDAKLQPADFGAAGEIVGQSVARLGQQGQQFAEQQQQLAEVHDDAATKFAANAVNDWHTKAGYTGDDPYFMKDGKSALDARPAFQDGLDQTIKDQRALLKTPRQQKMFDEAMQPQRDQWLTQIAEHADKETKTWDVGESAGRQVNSANAAALVANTDPKNSEQQLQTGLDEVKHQGVIEGWGPDKTAAMQTKYISGTRKDIATNFVYSGQGGPEVAQAYLDQHRDQLTSDDAQAVQAHIRTYTNTIAAEQRRAEAEARRAQSEQDRATTDRVRDAIRSVGDGDIISPQVRARTEADLKTLKDPGVLADEWRKTTQKADLTIEHLGDTPAQLQDRLNTVNAQIAKGGTADLKTESDQLTSLLAKSNAELHDPLSWMAKHRAIDPGHLDINNPASINARIGVARQATAITGAPLRVFTDEEAAGLTPTVTTGSVAQRTQLVGNLAKFGSLAISAAQQLAPGNAPFENLVSLGTLSNKTVAASRVNQIITGQEILKTNTKLVVNDQAEQQFNGLVGNALQFLPSVRAGVLANSKAILADDANHNNVHDWASASGRYGAAVSSALGGYHIGNVQYGGLATYNGAPTVLPTDMTQQDFEARVSRATGPGFVAASGNRTPFFANGKVPNATALKKMQWVPAGDGIYRLNDGSGFVHTRDGNFYQIDVRKLH